MKYILIILTALIMTSCFQTKFEDVEKLRIGMSKEEMFRVVPKRGWGDRYDNKYIYYYNFHNPEGYKSTLSVTIENDKITDISTI